MPRNHTKPNGSLCALLLGEFENDKQLLRAIFRRTGWLLFEARDRRTGQQCLGENPVHVVIVETDIERDWNWKDILCDLGSMAYPPQMLVTSRLADDVLWAEVLNAGGYDVLASPLAADEVERVIASAWRHSSAIQTANHY